VLNTKLEKKNDERNREKNSPKASKPNERKRHKHRKGTRQILGGGRRIKHPPRKSRNLGLAKIHQAPAWSGNENKSFLGMNRTKLTGPGGGRELKLGGTGYRRELNEFAKKKRGQKRGEDKKTQETKGPSAIQRGTRTSGGKSDARRGTKHLNQHQEGKGEKEKSPGQIKSRGQKSWKKPGLKVHMDTSSRGPVLKKY